MSYKIIEKNQYGVKVKNTTDICVCEICKYRYLPLEHNVCKKCYMDSYYLPDSEAEKLESENQLMNTTIDDLYIESKCYFEVKKKLDDTQKELIELQNENKQLKDRVKELENNTTELSENQIAELAQIGSKYLYLGALEEGRISYGGIIEILKRYNEMCK